MTAEFEAAPPRAAAPKLQSHVRQLRQISRGDGFQLPTVRYGLKSHRPGDKERCKLLLFC